MGTCFGSEGLIKPHDCLNGRNLSQKTAFPEIWKVKFGKRSRHLAERLLPQVKT